MMRVLWLGVLSSVVLLASSGNEARAQKGEDYYPLKVGSTWTYKLTVNGMALAMNTKIAKTEKVDGKELSVLEAEVNGKVAATERLEKTAKGVLRYSTNGVEAMPPFLLLKYPAKAGDKWSGDFTAGGKKAKFSSETSEETITVAAGKFKTLRVAIRLEESGQVVNTTYWFAPNVGYVKQTVDAGGLNIVMELEKYTIAK